MRQGTLFGCSLSLCLENGPLRLIERFFLPVKRIVKESF